MRVRKYIESRDVTALAYKYRLTVLQMTFHLCISDNLSGAAAVTGELSFFSNKIFQILTTNN